MSPPSSEDDDGPDDDDVDDDDPDDEGDSAPAGQSTGQSRDASPTARRNDPAPAFCFKLTIDGMSESETALFRSVAGLKSETEVVPYKEGGSNGTTRQLAGTAKWPNLVLKRGFAGSSRLLEWRQEVLDHDVGKTFPRKNGKVIQLAHDLKTVVAAWDFVSGWPCRWEGPDLDASKSELAIEIIEIAHEGLRLAK